jgi:hypothetical protein
VLPAELKHPQRDWCDNCSAKAALSGVNYFFGLTTTISPRQEI